MSELLKEKRILYRLIIIALITTPLFGLLSGTPFLRFEFDKINYFLPGILFNFSITFIFWIINISLLLLAGKFPFLEKLFPRSLISIFLCLSLSFIVFSYFNKNFPPPQIKFSAKEIQADSLNRAPALITNGPVFLKDEKGFNHLPPGMIKRPPRSFFFPQTLHAFTINIIILILCELIVVYFKKQKIEDENTRLKQFNLEAKNNQLTMQLHPHFLFNSLNTLRLLLKKDADKAEDYLLKLSDVLRFSTTSALESATDIADELKLCLTYLQMQKVRFGDMLNFKVTNENIFSAKGKLPVYSLQTLAENAIKHNAFSPEEPLSISIDFDETAGTITVKNKIRRKLLIEATTGVGLANLAERYRLLSNKSIVISNNGEEFAVTIQLITPDENNTNHSIL